MPALQIPCSSQSGGYFENGDYIPSNEFQTYLEPLENKNFTFPDQNELSIIQNQGLYLSYSFDPGVSMKRIQLEAPASKTYFVGLELSLIDQNFFQNYRVDWDENGGEYKFYYDSYLTLNLTALDWGDKVTLRFPIEDIFPSDLSREYTILHPFYIVDDDYSQISQLQYTETEEYIEVEIGNYGYDSSPIKFGFLYEGTVPVQYSPAGGNSGTVILIVIGSIVVVFLLLSSMTTDQFRTYFSRTAFPRSTFHRLRIDEIFENENRIKILNTILQQPGVHLSELMRDTGLQAGQLGWHLELLVSYGVIKTEKMGSYQVFYPAFTENPLAGIDITIAKSQATLDVLRTIKKNPGITASEIGRTLNLKRNTIKYHVDKLLEKGFLRKVKAGNRFKLYLTEAPQDFYFVDRSIQ